MIVLDRNSLVEYSSNITEQTRFAVVVRDFNRKPDGKVQDSTYVPDYRALIVRNTPEKGYDYFALTFQDVAFYECDQCVVQKYAEKFNKLWSLGVYPCLPSLLGSKDVSRKYSSSVENPD